MILTYKEDTDAPNKTYKEVTDEVYGQVDYRFDSEHVKGEQKKELIFSPTPVTKNDFGAVVPMLSGVAPKTNIRILLDSGLKACPSFTIVDYINGSGVAVGTTSTNYPLLSHFDKENDPTFDINFATCDYYYYPVGARTINNLFNLKWRRTISQMNSGKGLIAYFNLTQVDIHNLRLSDKIQIGNAKFHINQINYNANGKGAPTQVELMTADTEIDLVNFRITRPSYPAIGDVQLLSVGEVIGQGYEDANVVLSSNYPQIEGVNNIVGEDAQGVIIFGNENSVQAQRAVVVGDQIQVNRSGVFSEFVSAREAEFEIEPKIEGRAMSEIFQRQETSINPVGMSGVLSMWATTTNSETANMTDPFTLSIDSTYSFSFDLVAMNSSGNSIVYACAICTKNNGGTISVIGTPTVVEKFADEEISVTVNLSTDDTTMFVEVTGQDGQIINWYLTGTYIKVNQ
jgi:hypothetical protein